MIKFKNPFTKIPGEYQLPPMRAAIAALESGCKTNLMKEDQINLFCTLCREYPKGSILISSQKTCKSNERVSLTFLIRKKEGKKDIFYCERQEVRTWYRADSFILRILENEK